MSSNRKGKPLGYEGKEPFFGIDHFGIWLDDAEEGRSCRATHLMGNKTGAPNSFYGFGGQFKKIRSTVVRSPPG